MNASDKMAAKAKTTEHQLAAVAGSDKSDEPLPNNLEGTSDQRKPVEWEDVLLGISHHLDDGTSERKAVNDRLLAMESELKRRGSTGFTRYLLAICIGVAATLAWQSYGETTKQMIAGPRKARHFRSNGGKIRITSLLWKAPKVILRDEVPEVRNLDGRP